MTDRIFEEVAYESLAAEYYDASRHPTCANLASASTKLLTPWLNQVFTTGGWVCEVGSGKSMAANWLQSLDHSLKRLILIDSSPGMLAHSLPWLTMGARLLRSDAREIPLADNSMPIVIASLGDPYNQLKFWQETRRVLQRSGVALFTTPAYEWARQFREAHHTHIDRAEFQLMHGQTVLVPSYIRPEGDQISLIEKAGFRVADVSHITVRDLGAERISQKFSINRANANDQIATGYFAVAR